jgi:DNA-binding NarL/FixJ family response regulator
MAYRLLIVPGDNEELRALPGQLADDVEVRILDTANDALWEVRNSPPEVIVADLELPGMSGLDLAEILPNFGVPTRVVLWSRSPNRKAAEEAATHGVHLFLNGPLSSSELHNALYEALGRSDSSSGTPAGAATPAPAAPAPAAPDPPAPAAPEVQRPATRMSERPRRERTIAPATPPAPTAPPAPAVRKQGRPRGGSLVLTAENLKPIRDRMEALSQDIGSQCILLANRAGMVLGEVGITSGLPTMIMLPLLSTSFSTGDQISQMLRDEESNALFVHEGQRYDLYCFDILQSFMLVIVFDKGGSANAKIGSVWVYAKRAIRDMQELLG